MPTHEMFEQRRQHLEKAERAFDLLADPDVSHQLANDQELRDAFLRLITGNGNRVSASAENARVRPPEGSQLRAVLDAASQETGNFTPKELAEHMEANDYHFEAKYPQIAVNSALKQLQERRWVRLVRQGRGQAASVFSYIRGKTVLRQKAERPRASSRQE